MKPHFTTDFKSMPSPTIEASDIPELGHSIILHDAVLSSNPIHPLYNPDVYSSLRKGAPVKLYSKHCFGLAAAAFSGAFSCACILSSIQPMLRERFGLSPAEVAASQRLTSMPQTVCFLIGLLSDCFPILGHRRKAYVLLGIAIVAVGFWCLAALDMFVEAYDSDHTGNHLTALALGVAAVTVTGNMMLYLNIQTRVIELSQREPLGSRGKIQAAYMVLQYIVLLIADSCVYIVTRTNTESTSNRSTAFAVYGLVVALPAPLIYKFWEEKRYSLPTTIKTRAQILWKIMQQKAVWSVLAFQCFFTLFNQVNFSGPMMIINAWAGASGDNMFEQQVIFCVVVCVTVIAWRYFFMNRPWRVFYAMAPFLTIVPRLIVAILVSQDIFRNHLFYRLMGLFNNVSYAICMLSTFIPLAEIVQEGSEGAMTGLMLSVYFLGTIFVETNSVGLFEGSNFYDVADVKADNSKARWDVLMALVVNYGINAVAFIGIFFLPKQKLETQQLRTYGGYTKGASAAIVTFAITMFTYSFVISILTFIPSTSCIRIAGGPGC